MEYSKADTHMHTTFSDGKFTPEETVDYIAANTDLRVIAITDHDSAEGSIVARDYALRQRVPLEVIVSQEVMSDEGDIVGLFLHRTLPAYRSARAAIDAIHAQGGLAIAVHPFSSWATAGQMHGVGRLLLELPLDGVEVRNGFPGNLLANPLTRWVNRRRSKPLSELGGSDSHYLYTISQAHTLFPGRSADDLRRAIEAGTARAAGPYWRPSSLAKVLPVIFTRGLPENNHKRVYADEFPNPSEELLEK